MACTSSGCKPQKSAICSKVSVVFSTSQTAVAFGISGACIVNLGLGTGRCHRGHKRQRLYNCRSPCEKAAAWDGGVMDEAELEPRRKPVQPKDLGVMSVAELEAYIAELDAEIARARAEITLKLGQRRGAE